jgi:hypothetical protein
MSCFKESRDGWLLNCENNTPYEIKNVTSNPAYAEELKAASGQCVSPSLDIDGTMLADASVEDVAKMLEERGLII